MLIVAHAWVLEMRADRDLEEFDLESSTDGDMVSVAVLRGPYDLPVSSDER